MNLFLLLFQLLLASLTFAQVDSSKSVVETREISVYNFEQLEPLLYTNSDTTYLVNFWAMWCMPCVRELPIFQEYQNKHPNVEVILVSLDFTEDIETKLKPFLQKKGITSQVVLLDDPDSNSWIDKIDPNWSGALPFTILFNNKNRSFHERPFVDLEDLENEINNTIKIK